MPGLDPAIQRWATLIKAFSPDDRDAHPTPLFDRNDAYYFPVGGFRGGGQARSARRALAAG